MKITAIKQQIQHTSRYSIFIDGRFTLSLSDVALLDSRVVVGQELSSEDLGKLKKASVADRLYANTLRFVMIRARSEWEIVTYLKRKLASPQEIDKIIEKLRLGGLLDDKAFAKSWVENRRLLRSASTRRLILELKQKHISETVISQVINEDVTDERTALKQLIERKRRIPRYRLDNLKLMQYLARQGYDYGSIKDALSDEDA
jgi:regulatory protein